MNRKSIFFAILSVLLLILVPTVIAEEESVQYDAHIQDIGWMKPASDGQTAGTTGHALPLEALQVKLNGVSDDSHINYSAHVQDIGWQTPESQDGDVAGTTGQSKHIEAIKINISGAIASTYDIYYRTHIADYGWLDWAKNGDIAGSTGLSKPVEAYEVKLVPKDAEAPGAIERPYVYPQGIGYSAHVEDIGWQGRVLNGESAGTTGQSKHIEAIRIDLLDIPGSIEYNTYVQGRGWQDPTQNGAVSGTTGQNLPIEAMNIVLTGEASQDYDVYYRTHVADVGWLGWAVNGAPAGSSNGEKAIEAFEIKLVEKGAAAPGDTTNSYPNLEGLNKVVAKPGLRTVQNFLATALLPVGQTSYVFGGGWNEPDDGAGEGALTIGLHPNWVPFFKNQDANYDYTKTKFQILNGLDCSGYVGWAVYNLLNTESGNASAGEVYLADRQAKQYAQKGYGTYTNYGEVKNFLPGDVVSLEKDAHVYIVIGQCSDGSVVLSHASPPGVMLTGTLGPNGEETEATKLSHTYMQRYYPEFYSRYNSKLNRNYSPYIDKTGKMSWGDNFVGDPDGIRDHSAAEVLKILYNEK